MIDKFPGLITHHVLTVGFRADGQLVMNIAPEALQHVRDYSPEMQERFLRALDVGMERFKQLVRDSTLQLPRPERPEQLGKEAD